MKKAGGEYRLKNVECPSCKEKMKMKTLTSDMTPYEWGIWIYCNIRRYNSPHYKFRDKVHFNSIHDNFIMMGNRIITNDFWRGYDYAKVKYNNEGRELLDAINLRYGLDEKTKLKIKLDGWIT